MTVKSIAAALRDQKFTTLFYKFNYSKRIGEPMHERGRTPEEPYGRPDSHTRTNIQMFPINTLVTILK